MRKLSVLLVLAMLSGAVFAQKNRVTSAWSYLKDGFLDDAKESIDKAENHESTKNWYKTFYFKGMIYQNIGVSEKPKYQALCDNCLDVSYDAYLKALRLNFTNEEDKNIDLSSEMGFMSFIKILRENDERNYEDTQTLMDIIGNRLPALSNAFINEGVELFEKQEFKNAYNKFEKSIEIATLSFKADTQLYYFASLAALKAELFEEAMQLNEVLIEMNYGATPEDKASVYINQASACKMIGDTAKMLETLELGIKNLPNNNYHLVIEMFNYYVNAGQNEKAFEYISMAIEQNPQDPQFYVIRGTLLEELGRKTEAQKEYESAIGLAPENFDANYSLGAFYFNTAVDTIAWAETNIPINEFAKLEQYQNIATDCFKKSLPYLEKAYAQKPKDVNLLSTLKTIYYRVQDMEKYEVISAELDALTKQ